MAGLKTDSVRTAVQLTTGAPAKRVEAKWFTPGDAAVT